MQGEERSAGVRGPGLGAGGGAQGIEMEIPDSRFKTAGLKLPLHLVRASDLQLGRFSRILRAMEIHFTPEQETQLAQIANQKGTDAERLVRDAAVRLLEEDARFRAAVREGIAQADRGEFIEEEEMNARLERMLSS